MATLANTMSTQHEFLELFKTEFVIIDENYFGK